MPEIFNFLLAGLCIWSNYHRAKSKNASVTTGVLLGLFLNILGGWNFLLQNSNEEATQTAYEHNDF